MHKCINQWWIRGEGGESTAPLHNKGKRERNKGKREHDGRKRIKERENNIKKEEKIGKSRCVSIAHQDNSLESYQLLKLGSRTSPRRACLTLPPPPFVKSVEYQLKYNC